MTYTQRFTEGVALLDVIHSKSQTTVQNGAWVSIANYERLFALLDVGVIATNGTLNFKLQQATDTSGTGAKDITGKTITQLTEAGADSNKNVGIELRGEELDVSNGFDCVRMVMTPAVAAALCACFLFGTVPNYEKVSATPFDEIID
jgi:hypothetical protein